MMSEVFGSLLSSQQQEGGKRVSAPRGSKKNGKGRPFLGYEKLTLEELQAKARKYKIKYSGLNKAQLIAALRKK
jgi:hypothetical protein